MIRAVLIAALALAFLPAIAFAATPPTCLPRAERAWVRVLPAPMPMNAGYLRLRNTCAAPLAIVAASSPAYGEVSIHETRTVDGVSRMREVAELPLAPGATVEMKPGGLHLMLMRPTAPVRIGQRVRIDLHLKDGRRLPVEFEARAAAP